MKTSTLLFQLSFVLTTLTTHAVSDFTVQAEKLEDWIGCTNTQKQEVRDAWDSAIDIAISNALTAVLNNAHTFKRSY